MKYNNIIFLGLCLGLTTYSALSATRFQPEPSSQSLVSLLSMNNCDFDLSLCAPFTKIARIIIL